MNSEEHNRKIGIAQKRAWDDGRRERVPVGSKRIKNGKPQIKVISSNGWLYWKNETLPLPSTDKEFELLPAWTRSWLRKKKGVNVPKRKAGAKKGYKQSPDHVEKRRIAQRKYLFDLRTLDQEAKQRVRRSCEYTQWRLAVFVRDNWTCQNCNIRNGNGKEVYLEAHHKKSYTKYPELRFVVSNGITLCKDCHRIENKKQMKGNKNGCRKRLHPEISGR